MSTAIIKYGPFTIHWFGIIVALAMLAGVVASAVVARFRGQPLAPLAGILFLGVLSGLIGARLWYYLFRRDWYSPDPGRAFAVWQGGLALHGALAGGVLALLIYTWKKELNFWEWADICAPGLLLGQAIGRIGDIVNNQAFGRPTSGQFFVTIPLQNRPPQYVSFSHFTPTAAYEAVWDVAVLLILIGLMLLQRWRPRLWPVGSIFLAYIVLYSVGRLPLEGLRTDSLYLGNMRVAQLASGVLVAVGVALYGIRLLPKRARVDVPAPVSHGRVSDAYLVAASRSSQARLGSSLQDWDDLDNDVDVDRKGRQQMTTMKLPASNPPNTRKAEASLPPAEEAM